MIETHHDHDPAQSNRSDRQVRIRRSQEAMGAAAAAAVLDQLPRGGRRRRRVEEAAVGLASSSSSSSLLAAAAALLLLLALGGPAAEAHGAHGVGNRRALLNAFEPGALQVRFRAGCGFACDV